MLINSVGNNIGNISLTIQVVPVTNAMGRITGYRLDIYNGQICIGEYERCQKAKHMARKEDEVQCASQILMSIYAQHGQFKVRWVGETGNRRKEIRSQKDDRVLDIVPRSCWGAS